LIVRAERVGIQLPRARCIESHSKPNDLAREAVSCNAGLGGQGKLLLTVYPHLCYHKSVLLE